jgi:hypothetical protein
MRRSTGNFCNTMMNELCRVGLLQTLRLRPPPSHPPPERRHCTWSPLAWHWLFNEAAVLRGSRLALAPRSTLLVASDGSVDAALAGAAEAARLGGRKRRLVDFVRAHVLGGGSVAEAGAKRARPEDARPPRFFL